MQTPTMRMTASTKYAWPKLSPRSGLAPRLVRPAELADHDQDHDAEHRHRADELDEDVVRSPLADDREQPVGLEQLADGVDDRQQQREEAHRHEPVRDTDDAPAVHAGVAEELLGHGDGALYGLIGAGARGHVLAEPHEGVDLQEGAGEKCHADHDQNQRHDDRGELHLGAPRACEGGIQRVQAITKQ